MAREINNFIKETFQGPIGSGEIQVHLDTMCRTGIFKPGHKVLVRGEAYEITAVSTAMVLTDPGIPFECLALRHVGPLPGEIWEWAPAGESSERYSICGEGICMRTDEPYIVANRCTNAVITVWPKAFLLNNLHIFKKVEE